MSRHPEVKWAQSVDKVYLTVLLPDAKNVKVNLEPEGVFTFSANAGADSNSYELKIDLHDKVNVEESKINTGVRSVFCIIEKAEKGWWKKLLRGDSKTPHYVKVDWDKWVDEDEGEGPANMDLGGMDFSNFGGMGGGMPGMGMPGMGMPGMGMPDFGGMGMPGMGDGMGMPDGMDDDLDDSDDEEQAEKPENTVKAENAGKSEETSSDAKVEIAPTT